MYGCIVLENLVQNYSSAVSCESVFSLHTMNKNMSGWCKNTFPLKLYINMLVDFLYKFVFIDSRPDDLGRPRQTLVWRCYLLQDVQVPADLLPDLLQLHAGGHSHGQAPCYHKTSHHAWLSIQTAVICLAVLPATFPPMSFHFHGGFKRLPA